MVKKDFVNRKTLLVADTKPTPQIAEAVNLEELDSGNIYKSNGSVISIWNGPDKAETLKNKIIPVEDNELPDFNTTIDNPFLKNFENKGHVIPSTSPANSLHGLLEGSVLYNPITTIKHIASVGYVAGFESTVDDEKLGFAPNLAIFRRDKGYELKTEVKTNAQRMLIGFSTNTEFDTASVFTNTQKGVAIGWIEGGSNFITAYYNDGTGAVQSVASIINKGINLHTYEIILSTANIRIILDDGAQTLTLSTRIPGLTDNLYLLAYGVH